MLRFIALTCLTLTLAIGGGLGSLDHALRRVDSFAPVQIGGWHAYPKSGLTDMDPYARARMAKFNHLALGTTEGVSFYLWYDAEGQPLKPTCSYVLDGFLPPTQFFTLYAAGRDLVPKRSTRGRPDSLTSFNTVRRADGGYLLAISPHPQAGNWLAIEGEMPYGLIMTLYDSSVGVTTGLAEATMPSLTREGRCQD